MFNFLDEIPALPESASPGLAPLPGDGAPPPAASPGFAAPAPAAPPPQAATAPTTSGLGLADFKSARNQDDKEYLENLPIAQKIGLVLQSYQAGVEGRPNPVETLLANKQKREKEFRAELATTIRVTKEGMEMVRRMPAGKARDAMIEQLVRASGGNGDMVRAALTAVGGEADREFKAALEVLDTPAAQTMLTQASGGDPAKARELLANDGFMKRLEQRADQVTLPAVTAKMSVVARTLEKVPGKFKDAEGRVSFTMADLREQNGKLPQQYRLTDAEMAAATRNQGALVAYGLKTDTTLQKEQEADAKRPDDAPQTGVAKANADLKAGRITPEQHRDEIRRLNMAVEKQDTRPEPAPTVVEIAGPDGKPIKVDAKTLRKIGDSPVKTKTERALPTPMVNSLVDATQTADSTAKFQTLWKDSYGGKTLIGGLGNVVGKVVGDDTGQVDWWQDYELHQSQIRNKLFGSALTETENKEWQKSAINPRMDPGVIRRNLKRRAELEQKALDRLLKAAVAGGYSREQIEALTGRTVADGKTPETPKAPTAPKADVAPAGDVAAQAKASWGAYEPDKYEYRMANGKLQRRAK